MNPWIARWIKRSGSTGKGVRRSEFGQRCSGGSVAVLLDPPYELEKVLPNGFTFTLSNEFYLSTNGEWFEGSGVPAAIDVPFFTQAERLAETVAAVMWGIAGFFCLSAVGSFMGKHRLERRLFAPLALLLAISSLRLAW